MSLARVKANRIAKFTPSIFTSMTMLAVEHKAVNLGQGAPDFDPPQFVKDFGSEACQSHAHQYTRAGGAVPLVKELAKFYGPRLQREIDPMTEVMVGGGATEVAYAALAGLVNPGDEVIIFEPFYDAYAAWVEMVGATAVFVPLVPASTLEAPLNAPSADGVVRASDYTFDPAVLRAAMGPKTRALILNTPHNPLGKVFSPAEMAFIAALVRGSDNAFVLSDEVYEHIVHDAAAAAQPRFCTLPGMWDRTVTVCSAGKTFSITGWKIGWALGSAPLIEAATLAHQTEIFCVSAPLQMAMAKALPATESNGYLAELNATFARRRDALFEGLEQAGLRPVLPQAGYFVVADGAPLAAKLGVEGAADPGLAIATALVEQVGVASIPVSRFYSQDHQQLGATLLRFAYCKQDEAIAAGLQRLRESPVLQ